MSSVSLCFHLSGSFSCQVSDFEGNELRSFEVPDRVRLMYLRQFADGNFLLLLTDSSRLQVRTFLSFSIQCREKYDYKTFGSVPLPVFSPLIVHIFRYCHATIRELRSLFLCMCRYIAA